MSNKRKFNALGRGLDALISSDEMTAEGGSTISEIPVAQIEANPNQPRRDFDQEALQELSRSISEIGIIQPITLRQTGPENYQIIAGERRWRATQMAGLDTIPAYIRTIDDDNVMEMALVENIQREDLNAIEIALAYQQLMQQEGMTQEKVADRVGKSRVAVANHLRLLRLPAQVQMALQKRQIDMGHARALLALENTEQQLALYNEIVKQGLSVRQVEELAKKMKAGQTADASQKGGKNNLPGEFSLLRKGLEELLGTKVSLQMGATGKGKISISFDNEEQLEHIMHVFDHLN